MKVAFLGNANNEPFRLAHELSKIGCRATVFPLSTQALDDPRLLGASPYYAESSVEVNNYLSMRRFTPALLHAIDLLPSRELMSLPSYLRGYDVLVLNQYAPSLVSVIGEKPYVSMLTGSDLVTMTDGFAMQRLLGRRARLAIGLAAAVSRWKSASAALEDFARRQARGIASSSNLICVDPRLSPALLERLRTIGAEYVPQTRWDCGIPLQKHVAEKEQRARTPARRFRCLVGARLNVGWRGTESERVYDDKGSLTLLEGWAQAVSEGLDGELFLIRKGVDAGYIDERIHQLGLGGMTTWLGPMTYVPFAKVMLSADVVVDSLSGGILGRVSVDALSSGIPLIANASAPVQETRFGSTQTLLMHCSTVQDVAASLRSASRRTAAGGDVKAAQIPDSALDPRHFLPGVVSALESAARR